jgi:hypothetical protein
MITIIVVITLTGIAAQLYQNNKMKRSYEAEIQKQNETIINISEQNKELESILKE